MTSVQVNIILAHDNDYGIGKDNYIPWKSKEDMNIFKQLTYGNTLVVGRVTWNGFGDNIRRKIHENRHIIVISANSDQVAIPHTFERFTTTNTYDSAVDIAMSHGRDVFIIGGASVYEQAFDDERVNSCMITRIYGTYNCDTNVKFIRKHLCENWEMITKVILDDKGDIMFSVYHRRHQEYQYLKILQDIMISGTEMNDRTGIGIKSVFGKQIRFDCSKSFPLLTTKKMFVKGIIEELLWFIKGSTNSNELEEKGVRIWKGNTSREYLDALGFYDREEGDIGPGYGHQWRFWNAPYTNCNGDYSGKGIDQLNDCIKRIQNEKLKNVHDRRNLMIAWNPEQVDEMSLPPCHVLVQFYLCDNELSLHMYQRSADMFLGVPFNIASYALLLNMVADHTQCLAKDLVMSFGDCHIYSNHYSAVENQLMNSPKKFPTLKLHEANIFKVKREDIEIIDYECHEAIRAPMAV